MFTELWLHPALILIVGALILPLVKGVARKPFLMLVPVLAFAAVLLMEQGTYGVFPFLDWNLTFGRVDKLSLVFAYIMTLMCIIGTLFGLHVENDYEYMAAWFYVAGSLGVIFAGDFLVLFLFWEVMAFSSVFLVWFRGRQQSLAAGYRYLLVHTAGGLALLAGIVLQYQATGDLSFNLLDVSNPTLALYLILIGFILNAAAPPFHAWLPDAYSEATVSGAVFMCAFTTKTAVYALARGFAGMEILIALGVMMTLYGVIYATLENDGRRLLSYHVISQVGFMVAGIGIGTELAINGACAHAFAHILYKALLFMGVGSVLYMTGKSKLTELGGLYKKMPLAFLFTLIGGLSISGFPLLSGFVSKSMIIAGGFDDHLYWAAFLMMLASVGTFLSVGLKMTYFIWFGKNNCSQETWDKAADPPMHMNYAMGFTAFLCFFIGVYTPYLYNMLPYAVEYRPYTAYHLAEVIQILLFTALAFFLVVKKLAPKPMISLDVDWFYRMSGSVFKVTADRSMTYVNQWGQETLAEAIPHRLNRFFLEGPARLCLLVVKPIWQLTGVRIDGPDGAEHRFLETFSRSLFTIGSSAIFTVIVLLVLLYSIM
ncbi:Na(+)/H(+) antiporter subunit D [Desulfobulbus alkaliphilus]|uniref:Na(+)/H(+) antiporter subunit D n=1 Tax=Desulfobulbus alkaliphilus TaxID=869814 RepID=UPI0019645569|nr:Na(+)/H(+) antiporter subunit D [Desulfobulbus alkaliphilus]MBM9537025.1 Na(+)/H(+) antiporter subunit D [Desulfobulbus alkaliphilus]